MADIIILIPTTKERKNAKAPEGALNFFTLLFYGFIVIVIIVPNVFCRAS